jgi:glucose-1-phosphate adenylyltransferase
MPRTNQPRILAMIMAGGRGERLAPLDLHQTRGPFGGNIALSTLCPAIVNSNAGHLRARAISFPVAYRALAAGVADRWAYSPELLTGPPQMKTGAMVAEGTADAVYQNINLIPDFAPDLVAVFGADHIYRMDIRQMVDFHLARKAKSRWRPAGPWRRPRRSG